MSVRRGTLWVVDPSMRHPEDEGVAEVVRGWEGDVRLFRPALSEGDGPSPTDGHAADGLVVMGSAASVEDDLPWLARLADWLAPVVAGDVDVPLLGICFGHQLIAHRSGGRVGWLEPGRTKRRGVEESTLASCTLVPGGGPHRVVVSHREEVKELGPGYRVTAQRGPVRIDGFEHEHRPIFGFQFHPEAREEFAGHAGIDPSLIDARLRRDSRRILDGFVRVVRERN